MPVPMTQSAISEQQDAQPATSDYYHKAKSADYTQQNATLLVHLPDSADSESATDYSRSLSQYRP